MTFAMTAMTISLGLAAAGDAPSAPPPPPPPPAAVLVHGLAYFETGRDRRIARAGFDPIAHLAARTPADAFAFIRAQTDTVGDAQANHDLSLRRAHAIADEVAAMGVNPDRITLIACGEQALAVPTPDNVNEPANRVAEFSWGRSPPAAEDGCTARPYRPLPTRAPVLVPAAVAQPAARPPAITLSRAQAEAMSTAELTQRLFPDLAPQTAFRSRVSASNRSGGEGLTGVSVYTRPNDLGDGVCGAIRHSYIVSRLSPDHAEATAATPVVLDWRQDLVTFFMRPTSGPEAATPCADHNPERFYGVRPLSVRLEPPYPLTASKVLRKAVVDGVDMPIDCVDQTGSRACDTPGAALKAFEPDRVISIFPGAGPDARCPGDDAAAGCWQFTTDLYGPTCGAWIVTVSVRANRMTGLRMRRSCIAFH